MAALGTALVLWLRSPARPSTEPPAPLVPALLAALYAAGYPYLPPIIRAALAFAAMGSLLSAWRWGRGFDAGWTGLLLLGLPVRPTLQFYLGYPLRRAVARMKG